MIDIHTHILPQVDDGSRSWEMTLEMCRVAVADGIEHIVATPHANDEYVYDRDRHLALLATVRDAVPELTFSLGCDFHMSYDNIEDALHYPRRYTIGDTSYLLVEFSDFSIPPQTEDHLFALRAAGMTPVITHPERNPILQKHPERVVQWADAGCVVQVTANSLTGRWGKSASKTAEWLLKKRVVHVLASDAHDPKHRPPVLSAGRKAAAAMVGEEVATALVQENPQKIVEGRSL